MIRLRCMLERGCAHPVLGPLVLLVLALLLSMLFLHVAQDGHEALTDFGAACIALATVLGLLILDRLPGRRARPLIGVRGDRGPPSAGGTHAPRAVVAPALTRSLPLRR